MVGLDDLARDRHTEQPRGEAQQVPARHHEHEGEQRERGQRAPYAPPLGEQHEDEAERDGDERATAQPELEPDERQHDEARCHRADDRPDGVERVRLTHVAADVVLAAAHEAHRDGEHAAHRQRGQEQGEQREDELTHDDALDGERAAAQQREERAGELVDDLVRREHHRTHGQVNRAQPHDGVSRARADRSQDRGARGQPDEEREQDEREGIDRRADDDGERSVPQHLAHHGRSARDGERAEHEPAHARRDGQRFGGRGELERVGLLGQGRFVRRAAAGMAAHGEHEAREHEVGQRCDEVGAVLADGGQEREAAHERADDRAERVPRVQRTD